MVNGEAKSSSSPPVVSITNPSIDISSPSNNQSSGGKQVSLVSQKKKKNNETYEKSAKNSSNFVYILFFFILTIFLISLKSDEFYLQKNRRKVRQTLFTFKSPFILTRFFISLKIIQNLKLCLFTLGWPNEDICADNTKEERGT